MSELGWAWIQVIGGIGFLALGGNWLVGGASALATVARISPLVVGLTVVGFGTSAPEFAVSASAALQGNGDIAVGNVVGSNIANVLLILALSAVVAPLTISRAVYRRDLPAMILAAFAAWGCAYFGRIHVWQGAVLFLSLCAYVWWTVRSSESEGDPIAPTPVGPPPSVPLSLLKIVVGLVILIVAADQLVKGSSLIAKGLGVSDLVIGLTIVAVGTSLPELAASVAATAKGQRDIAVGNVVGSNVFNVLGVLGVSAAVAPNPLLVPASAVRLDIPIMVGVSLLCLPVAAAGRMGRTAGLGFLLLYAGYIVLLASRESPSG